MKTVFVIEDDAHLRMLYEEELSEEGYSVVTCSGNRTALHRIRASAPDLLVMETRLSTCDGLNLLRRILDAFPEMPVVVCSACEALPGRFEEHTGVDAFVVKSTDWGRLKSTVKRLLGFSDPLPQRTGPARRASRRPMIQQAFPWKLSGVDGWVP